MKSGQSQTGPWTASEPFITSGCPTKEIFVQSDGSAISRISQTGAPMSQNKKSQKWVASVPSCIFCGQPADSVEDAFPKWLIEYLDKHFPPPPATPGMPPILLERLIGIGNEPEIRYDDLKIPVKCVCQSCNNGWMSVIQNEHAKPIFTRLMEDPSVTLNIHQCRSLTLWGVMTTMVMETIYQPEYWRFTDLERCHFWHRRVIPNNTYMWIARWNDRSGRAVLGRLLSLEGTPHRGLLNTIGFGTFILQILKMNTSAIADPHDESFGQSLAEVCPLRGNPISFPPPTDIDGNSGIEQLGLRFSPPGTLSGEAGKEVVDRAINRWRSSHRRLGPPPPANAS